MKSLFLGIALAGVVQAAPALEVDSAECREGAQFIGNAAQSRKNGATREFFLGKLDEDLMLLSSIPPHLRWFAHGNDEAQFLRDAVIEVFAFPREPREHASAFLATCLKSAGIEDKDSEPRQADIDDEPADDWRERA